MSLLQNPKLLDVVQPKKLPTKLKTVSCEANRNIWIDCSQILCTICLTWDINVSQGD